MDKIFCLALIAGAALPAPAVDFDRGTGFASFAEQARAVSLPSPSFHAEPALAWSAPPAAVPDQRIVELIGRISEWSARKEDMRQAVNAFYGNVVAREGNGQEWYRMLRKVWGLAEGVESIEDTVAARFSDRVAAAETDPARRDWRLGAIRAVRDARRFVLYGNLIPRVLDEAHKDARGLDDGRSYAGPTWSLVMTWDEGTALDKALIAQTGFSEADYAAERKSVHPAIAP